MVASRPIDVANTQAVLHNLGRDTLAAVYMQHHALERVRNSCASDKALCYRIQGDVARADNVSDKAVSLTLGYAISPTISAGVGVSRSLGRTLGDSYDSNHYNNHALGVFAQYRKPVEGGEWFAEPSVAWNNYELQVSRPVLANTEAAHGTQRVKAFALGVRAGRKYQRSEQHWQWYAGLDHSRVERAAYRESNALFPVQFGALTYRDTALRFGAAAQMPLSPQLTAMVRADGSYSLAVDAPQYHAQAPYIGDFVYQGQVNKLRGSVSAGLDYQINPRTNAYIAPYIGRNLAGKTISGVSVGLTGKF